MTADCFFQQLPIGLDVVAFRLVFNLVLLMLRQVPVRLDSERCVFLKFKSVARHEFADAGVECFLA